MEKSASQVLREARALIDSPEKWLRGSGAWSGDSRCIGCALIHARMGDKTAPAWFTDADNKILLANFATQSGIGEGFIAVFKFNETASHPEVLAAFDRAIALAEKDEPQRKPREDDATWAARMVSEVTKQDAPAARELEWHRDNAQTLK